jgi:adenylosuccinate synthase
MVNKVVDILVGLSFGSCGKGKFMTILDDVPYKALVRTGSSNAAHSCVFNGSTYVYHIIPCGAMHFPQAKLVIGAAAQLDIDHLKHEIQMVEEAGFSVKDRLIIDPNAVIVDTIDKVAENGGRMPDCGDLYFHPIDCDEHAKLGGSCEKCDKLPKDSAWKALGSTTHGCGANLVRKTIRGTKMAVLPGQELDIAAYIRSKVCKDATNDQISKAAMDLLDEDYITDWGEFIKPEPVRYADEDEFFKPYIGDTVKYLNGFIDNNEPILLEGTQGALLSLHHGYRKKTTSRDTNASNWCADAGISPLAVRDVYGVTRAFPIRVAGNSGPTSGQEITWEEITEHAESPEPIVEITTATKRKRRVFTFGEEDFRKAININRPTKLMLSFVDYLKYEDRHKTSWDSLTQSTKDWITTLESKMGVFFKYLSTGPAPEHTVIRKSPGEIVAKIQSGI